MQAESSQGAALGDVSSRDRAATRRTIAEVAREIARVIFLDDYRPAEIETKLSEFMEGK
jgi:hypothetical protein